MPDQLPQPRCPRHAYVATLTPADPLAEADRLMDEAIALQDDGEFAAADALFDRAADLLASA